MRSRPIAASTVRTSSRRAAAARGASSSLTLIKFGLVLGAGRCGPDARLGRSSRSRRFCASTRIQPVGQSARAVGRRARAARAGCAARTSCSRTSNAWRATLLESPWVRDASFRRSLPSTIDVVVQERTPIAVGRIGGTAVSRRRARHGPSTSSDPSTATSTCRSSTASRRRDADRGADEAQGAIAARLIVALRQKPMIAKRLSQVDVTDPHNVSSPAQRRSRAAAPRRRPLSRAGRVVPVAGERRCDERVPDIDYVDLRFDGRVYVRPAGKPGKDRRVQSPDTRRSVA